MKVRILRQPTGTVYGVSLNNYHAGQVHEVAPTLANYLVLEGYARFEMRREPTRPDRTAARLTGLSTRKAKPHKARAVSWQRKRP